jgi:transposase
VDLCRRSGKSACQVARELGIPQPTFNRWMQQAATAPGGANSFLATEELKVLRREVEQLRMERDILKKAVAGSTGESNTRLQYSRWRLKPQRLPWTLVQA